MVPSSKYDDVMNGVKQRILDILFLLEKTYGSLDDYTISFNSKKERDETAKQIISIVNNYGDNISIGDNNKIEKSAIGKGNGN